MIKINVAPPLTKKARAVTAVAVGAPGLNLGALFGALFAGLIVVVGAWWLLLFVEVSRLSAETEANRREMERLKPIIEAGQRYKRDKEELERRLNAIETVARNQARPVYLLDAMADTLPPDLWLTRLEEKGPGLRITGTAYSSVALSDFMANLKASGKFKEVDLLDAKQDLTKSPRTITFEVTCRFEV